MSKTILVVELSLSGHRGEYVRWIVQALLKDNYRVTLMLPENLFMHESIAALEHPSLEIKGFTIKNDTFVKRIILKLGLFGVDYLYYTAFKNIYKSSNRSNINHIFVPFFDYMLYSIAVFGSPFGKHSFSGITMRPDFHYMKMKVRVPKRRGLWFKEFMFDRVLKIKTLTKLLTLDQALYLYYKSMKQDTNKLEFLPEPASVLELSTDTKNRVENTLGINNSVKNILVYGSISLRKGIKGLLDAVMTVPDDLNFRVILAGKVDSGTLQLLENPEYQKLMNKGKLILLNKYIDSEEESALFYNAYICWLGYIGHYRASGVLIQSAKYGKPIIGTYEGLIGWQVEKFSMGLTVNSKESNEISKAICRLLNDIKFYQACINNSQKSFLDNTFDNAEYIVNKSVS